MIKYQSSPLTVTPWRLLKQVNYVQAIAGRNEMSVNSVVLLLQYHPPYPRQAFMELAEAFLQCFAASYEICTRPLTGFGNKVSGFINGRSATFLVWEANI